jgi:hypothetical protein
LTLSAPYIAGYYTSIDFLYNIATVPTARIAAYHDGLGSKIMFGTSNNYGVGITNTAMAIDTIGNVGIGRTDPGSALDIYRAGSTPMLNMYSDAHSVSQTIENRIRFGGWGSGGWSTPDGAGIDFHVNYPPEGANAQLRFWAYPYTTSTPAITINGGFVGIGTTAPTSKLYVTDTTTPSPGAIRVYADDVGAAGTQNYVCAVNADITSDGTPAGTWYSSGKLSWQDDRDTGIFANTLSAVVGNLFNCPAGFSCRSATFDGGATPQAPFIIMNGNVGIGTTAPLKSLHIAKGASYGTNDFILRSNANNADANTVLEGVGVKSISMGVSVNSLYQYYTTDSNIAYVILTTGSALDLAEWFKVGQANLDSNGNSNLKKGYVLCVDNQEKGKVVACSSTHSNILGIVSTNPYQTMGMNDLDDDHHDAAQVALVGSVPVIIQIQNNQQIVNGDYITASDLTGVGVKATQAGPVVAKAVESTNWNSQNCPCASSLESINWPEDDGTNPQKPCFRLPDGTYIGKIMVSVNPSWYDPDVNLTSAGDLNIEKNNNQYIVRNTQTNTVIDRVSTFAETVVGKVKAGVIETKKLVVDSVDILKKINELNGKAGRQQKELDSNITKLSRENQELGKANRELKSEMENLKVRLSRLEAKVK